MWWMAKFVFGLTCHLSGPAAVTWSMYFLSLSSSPLQKLLGWHSPENFQEFLGPAVLKSLQDLMLVMHHPWFCGGEWSFSSSTFPAVFAFSSFHSSPWFYCSMMLLMSYILHLHCKLVLSSVKHTETKGGECGKEQLWILWKLRGRAGIWPDDLHGTLLFPSAWERPFSSQALCRSSSEGIPLIPPKPLLPVCRVGMWLCSYECLNPEEERAFQLWQQQQSPLRFFPPSVLCVKLR